MNSVLNDGRSQCRISTLTLTLVLIELTLLLTLLTLNLTLLTLALTSHITLMLIMSIIRLYYLPFYPDLLSELTLTLTLTLTQDFSYMPFAQGPRGCIDGSGSVAEAVVEAVDVLQLGLGLGLGLGTVVEAVDVLGEDIMHQGPIRVRVRVRFRVMSWVQIRWTRVRTPCSSCSSPMRSLDVRLMAKGRIEGGICSLST